MKKKILTVLLALVMLANCISFAAMAEAEPIFPDLNIHAWYYSAVEFVYKNNILSGTGKYFEPDKEMSRAMLVTAIYRLEGATADSKNAFVDVPDNAWYAPAVTWASENGIVKGISATEFAPTTPITREQLATILYRYEQKNGGGFTGAWMIRMDYVDLADVSDWAYEAMCWMNMNAVINGKPGKILDPKGTATRAEAATMLQRYCELSGKDEKN